MLGVSRACATVPGDVGVRSNRRVGGALREDPPPIDRRRGVGFRPELFVWTTSTEASGCRRRRPARCCRGDRKRLVLRPATGANVVANPHCCRIGRGRVMTGRSIGPRSNGPLFAEPPADGRNRIRAEAVASAENRNRRVTWRATQMRRGRRRPRRRDAGYCSPRRRDVVMLQSRGTSTGASRHSMRPGARPCPRWVGEPMLAEIPTWGGRLVWSTEPRYVWRLPAGSPPLPLLAS